MRTLLTLTAVLAGTSCVYAGDVNPKWKDLGSNWSISVDRSNYGCFMLGQWERGLVIRLGYDANRDWYVWLSHEDWRSLEAGKHYTLTMKFDDQSPWSGPALAKRTKDGGSPYLQISMDREKPNFIHEFAVSHGVEIGYGNKIIARLKLTDSYAATAELTNCQRSVEASRNGQPAPSARPPTGQRVSDPFRGGSNRTDPFE